LASFHILAGVVFNKSTLNVHTVESASSVGPVKPAQSAVSVGRSVLRASQL